MSRYEVDALGRYNAEVARGIMHTPEWQQRMAEQQRLFDEQERARRIAEGFTEVSPGIWIGQRERVRRAWFRSGWFAR